MRLPGDTEVKFCELGRMVVVDDHHKVLTAWAELRQRSARPPRLLTLDYHTDTSAPFRGFLKRHHPAEVHERLRGEWIAKIDTQNPVSVQSALEKLGHDEHVVTAIQAGIIASAFVIAHNAKDTGAETYREHRIACYSVDRSGLRPRGASREEADRVLESEFLNAAIEKFDRVLADAGEPALRDEPYILDIDLDYFNTRASVRPGDSKLIRALAAQAKLVTVATEPDFVKSCALDGGLTSEELLIGLRNLIT